MNPTSTITSYTNTPPKITYKNKVQLVIPRTRPGGTFPKIPPPNVTVCKHKRGRTGLKQHIPNVKIPFRHITTAQLARNTLIADHVTWNPSRYVYGNAKPPTCGYRRQIHRFPGESANVRPCHNHLRYDNAVASYRPRPVVSHVTSSGTIMSTHNGFPHHTQVSPYAGGFKTEMRRYIQPQVFPQEDEEDEDVDVVGVHGSAILTIPSVGNSIKHGTAPLAEIEGESAIGRDGDTGDIFRYNINIDEDPMLLSTADIYQSETQDFGRNYIASESIPEFIKSDEAAVCDDYDFREHPIRIDPSTNGEPIIEFSADIHHLDIRSFLEHTATISLSAAIDEDKFKCFAYSDHRQKAADVLQYYDNFSLGPDVNLELFKRYDFNADVYDTLWNLCEKGSHFMEMTQCEICRKWGPPEGFSMHYILAHARTCFDEIYQDKLI